MNLTNYLHLITQPQSGIGKSYIAFLLRQYLESEKNLKTYSIKEFNIILWDKIFEFFFTHDQQNLLIDIDSVYYESFEQYLTEADILKTISDLKNKIIYHNIFTPGRNGEGTRRTLEYISGQIEKRVGETIIWENHNCGITLKQQTKGKFSRLSELTEFKSIESKIKSIILLPAESFCFQRDLSSHIFTGQTFDQAIFRSENNIIYRQRLYQIKKRTFEAIKNGNIGIRTANN